MYELYISFHDEEVTHSREIYSALDLVHDLVGVLQIILAIISLFIVPISDYNFNIKAFQSLLFIKTIN